MTFTFFSNLGPQLRICIYSEVIMEFSCLNF